VSYRIALAGKAHRIAEILIKPRSVEMVECVLDKHAREELENIQSSNNTFYR
jgi:hypothetical protein